ncbi:hypothetical protein Pmani_009975 [Petrolisthes manimaculis]|uniref:Uncharacterized protein n=1 Tax=Petrolisthes manimaculis TaxID=1843537 RepID=A0AAE1Q346_9EUCA|nr:hypothetical protein Pmani_009975 [Petrolisthes manimaculis]
MESYVSPVQLQQLHLPTPLDLLPPGPEGCSVLTHPHQHVSSRHIIPPLLTTAHLAMTTHDTAIHAHLEENRDGEASYNKIPIYLFSLLFHLIPSHTHRDVTEALENAHSAHHPAPENGSIKF